MKKAVLSTDIFRMSGLMKVPVEIPCDLMLRRDVDLFTPVIFFNKELPDVLSCISREMQSYQREGSRIRYRRGVKAVTRSGPLTLWYQSILRDVYSGSQLHESHPQTEKSSPPSFYIQGEIFIADRLSCYQYITLTLPPLWQNRRGLSAHADLSSLSRWPVHNNKAQRRLFLFRFFPDSGMWYASQARSKRLKRII